MSDPSKPQTRLPRTLIKAEPGVTSLPTTLLCGPGHALYPPGPVRDKSCFPLPPDGAMVREPSVWSLRLNPACPPNSEPLLRLKPGKGSS